MPLAAAMRSPLAFLRQRNGRKDFRAEPAASTDGASGGGASSSSSSAPAASLRKRSAPPSLGLWAGGGAAAAAGGSGASPRRQRDGGSRSGLGAARGSSRREKDGNGPGDTIRVHAPDGRLVDVTLPPGCVPGKRLTVEVPPAGGSPGSLPGAGGAVAAARGAAEAARASRDSLLRRLEEELGLQRGLWASEATATLPARGGGGDSITAATGAVELSQTQALVFAAAEAGDNKQLAAALAEARRFSEVSRSLEECVHELHGAEEAMVTWQCLLDALVAESRHEIEVWLEQAAGLGLTVPEGVRGAAAALRRQEEDVLRKFSRRRDAEQKLRFASEAGDPELLAEAIAEADAIGLSSKAVLAEAGAAAAARPAPGAAGGPPPPPGRASSAARGAGAGADAGAGAGGGAGAADAAAGDAREAYANDSRSAKELLEECRRRCLDTSGCTERADLLRVLQENQTAAKTRGSSVPQQRSRRSSEPGSFSSGAASASTGAVGDGLGAAGGGRAGAPSSGTVWDRRVCPSHLITRRSQSLYLLGLDALRMASPAELRAAYRRAAMESHPDKAQNHGRQDMAKELFQRVKDAFDYLNVPERDAMLRFTC